MKCTSCGHNNTNCSSDWDGCCYFCGEQMAVLSYEMSVEKTKDSFEMSNLYPVFASLQVNVAGQQFQPEIVNEYSHSKGVSYISGDFDKLKTFSSGWHAALNYITSQSRTLTKGYSLEGIIQDN